MGKGLIPADLETWKPRRRAIVPAFHKAYLQAMMRMFSECTRRSLEKFSCLSVGGQVAFPLQKECDSNQYRMHGLTSVIAPLLRGLTFAMRSGIRG